MKKKRYRDQLEIVRDILKELNGNKLLHSEICRNANLGAYPGRDMLQKMLQLDWITTEQKYHEDHNWHPNRKTFTYYKITLLGLEKLQILNNFYEEWYD